MTTFYSDRAELRLNGALVSVNILSASYTEDEAVSPVQTMTPDHTIGGFVRGNTLLTSEFEEALDQSGAGYIPDWSGIQWDAGTFILSMSQASASYVAPGGTGVPYNGPTVVLVGVVYMGSTGSNPGPGSAATRTVRFGAVRKQAF